MNREAIYAALFNLAKTATGINYTSRFLQPIDSVATANLPALFQHQVSDDPKFQLTPPRGGRRVSRGGRAVSH